MRTNSKPFTPPIVRREPPTIAEAIAAAQGLTPDPLLQVEIAAGLIGMSEDEIRPHMPVTTTRRSAPVISGARVVIVERRPSRGAARRTVPIAVRR